MRQFDEKAAIDRRAYEEQAAREREAYAEKSAREIEAFREEMRCHREAAREEMRQSDEKAAIDRKAYEERAAREREAYADKSVREIEAYAEKSVRLIEAYSEKSASEIEAFREEMRGHREAAREEMRLSDERVDKFLLESRNDKREHNLELGRIANKQGRMIEDLVEPSIGRIMKEALGLDQAEPCIENFRVIRPFRGDRSRRREFDAIAECQSYVLINETKSDITSRDIDRLIEKTKGIRDYFPEFAGRKLIGCVSSLHLDDSVINYATRKGVLALAVGDELMDIKNPPGFVLSTW
jgi:hypothetical protein